MKSAEIEIEGTDGETAVSIYITTACGDEIGNIGPNDMTDEMYAALRAKHGQIFGYYQGGTADGCEAW